VYGTPNNGKYLLKHITDRSISINTHTHTHKSCIKTEGQHTDKAK